VTNKWLRLTTSNMNTKITALLGFVFASLAWGAKQPVWIATWGASPAPQVESSTQDSKEKLDFENQTLREIVHTSLGSNMVRVRLSNAYGKEAVDVGSVHIAIRAKESSIVPGSDHALTFGGRPSVSIPPNALVLSDPIELKVPESGDLAISIFLPKHAKGSGIHYAAQQTSYVGQGDMTRAASIDNASTITSWIFLTGVDVTADNSAGTLVAFGDSITDGARSTVDANLRWPNVLANRLLEKKKHIGVLDAGIGGNRILHDAVSNVRFGVSALARFDRDVLAQPNVKYVIILEGINDLGHAGTSAPTSETVSAEDIIAGMKQMIERAHEKGIKVFGATLTPFEGTVFPGYFTAEKEAKRKAVNEWIRTGKGFDGVVDFDKAVQDPQHPDRMMATYDGGDHLHPGDAGYKAMGQAIDLSLFR
jgi:lysophospholipase L1-like esterase